jgi:hypothetical protein
MQQGTSAHVMVMVQGCIPTMLFCVCRLQAGQYEDATRTVTRVTSQGLSKAVNLLLVAAAYEQEDLASESWGAAAASRTAELAAVSTSAKQMQQDVW